MATLTLPVEGMSCAGCEHNIRFVLSGLAGVERVHADREAAHVEVVCDPAQTDESALRSAIEDMGYHVIDERLSRRAAVGIGERFTESTQRWGFHATAASRPRDGLEEPRARLGPVGHRRLLLRPRSMTASRRRG